MKNNFLWAFFASSSQSILQVIVFLILSRLLTPQEFGVVTIALVIVGFSTVISNAGVGAAIVQKPVITSVHINTGLIVSLVTGILLTIATYLLSDSLAIFFDMLQLSSLIKYLSLTFLLQGISSISEAVLQRELKFKLLSLINVSAYFLGYGIIGISLAFNDFGAASIIFAQLSQTLIKSLLILKSKPIKPNLSFNFKILKELVVFGAGYSFDYLNNYIALQADNFIVGKFLGAQNLGVYSRAYQLMNIPSTILGQVIDKVFFSSSARIQNDIPSLKAIFLKSMSSLAYILLPLSIFCYVMAKEIIYVVLGESWNQVVFPFQVLALFMLFRTGYKISNSVILGVGFVYKRATIQFLYALMVIACSIGGINFGVKGVAVGVSMAILVNYFLINRMCLKFLGISWRKFISIHFSSLKFTILTIVPVLIVKQFLRGISSYELLIINTVVFIVSIVISNLLFKKQLKNGYHDWAIKILSLNFRSVKG